MLAKLVTLHYYFVLTTKTNSIMDTLDATAKTFTNVSSNLTYDEDGPQYVLYQDEFYHIINMLGMFLYLFPLSKITVFMEILFKAHF